MDFWKVSHRTKNYNIKAYIPGTFGIDYEIFYTKIPRTNI